jgi:hypothetical protein
MVYAEFQTAVLLKAVEGTSAAVQGLTTIAMFTVTASAAVLFILEWRAPDAPSFLVFDLHNSIVHYAKTRKPRKTNTLIRTTKNG